MQILSLQNVSALRSQTCLFQTLKIPIAIKVGSTPIFSYFRKNWKRNRKKCKDSKLNNVVCLRQKRLKRVESYMLCIRACRRIQKRAAIINTVLMTQTPPTQRSSISKTSRCKVLKLKNKIVVKIRKMGLWRGWRSGRIWTFMEWGSTSRFTLVWSILFNR